MGFGKGSILYLAVPLISFLSINFYFPIKKKVTGCAQVALNYSDSLQLHN